MNKVTIIKSEHTPFNKKGDTIYADIQKLSLLHIDKTLDTTYSSVYEYNLASFNERFIDPHHKSLKPENIKWKPVELEKYNQQLREELNDSQIIIVENNLIKEFISKILDTEKVIVSIVQK